MAPLLALQNVATSALAETGSWSVLGPWIVGSVISALVVVWIVILVLEWSRRRQTHNVVRQSSLFDQLCHAHGLDSAQQQHLVRVAQTSAHGDVVAPFLDPRLLESASRETPELTALGHQLFGRAWHAPFAEK